MGEELGETLCCLYMGGEPNRRIRRSEPSSEPDSMPRLTTGFYEKMVGICWGKRKRRPRDRLRIGGSGSCMAAAFPSCT